MVTFTLLRSPKKGIWDPADALYGPVESAWRAYSLYCLTIHQIYRKWKYALKKKQTGKIMTWHVLFLFAPLQIQAEGQTWRGNHSACLLKARLKRKRHSPPFYWPLSLAGTLAPSMLNRWSKSTETCVTLTLANARPSTIHKFQEEFPYCSHYIANRRDTVCIMLR